MILRCLILISSLLLSGCPKSPHGPTTLEAPGARISQTRAQSDFTRIEVDGPFYVVLHTGARRPIVILKGDSRDLPAVITTVSDGKLHITIGSGYPKHGTIQAEIYTPTLTGFDYHGVGSIIGTRLHTGMLDLVLDNNGSTRLEGQLDLRRLDLRGTGTTDIAGINSPYLRIHLSGKPRVKLSGRMNVAALEVNNDARLSLYWIKSPVLTIRAFGQAFIQLAGVVEKLNVELWDNARFNGRYLRAKRAFVKTHDHAVAEMSAVSRQHTLASDTSDIHFYNLPTLRTDFMAKEGAVLDMRDLGSPYVEEYTDYNK